MDWSSEGMVWILMQPTGDEEMVKVTIILTITGECLFDLSKFGVRLKLVTFGSHSCTPVKKCIHLFTGEVASG